MSESTDFMVISALSNIVSLVVVYFVRACVCFLMNACYTFCFLSFYIFTLKVGYNEWRVATQRCPVPAAMLMHTLPVMSFYKACNRFEIPHN